jgi:hypothetical protein
MGSKSASFCPEAAVAYAKSKQWELPKKFKDADAVREIVKELVEEAVKDIKEDDRFECDRCKSVVQEPDVFCWFCGSDTSDDGSGGYAPEDEDKIVFESSKKASKKEEPAEEETAEEETAEEEPPKKTKAEKKAEKPSAAVLSEWEEKSKKKAKKEGKEKVVDELLSEAEAEEVEDEGPTSKALAKLEAPADGEVAVYKTLKEYTSAIRTLNANTGMMAWKIGKLLLEVKETKQFRDGYANMADYVTKEIGYSWQQARNFMRYAQVVEQDQAEKLGIYKLEILARSPEEAKDRMLKAALPKDVGGQGLNRDQLENKLKTEREKLQGREKSPRGRKPEPNKHLRIHDLIGTSIEVQTDSDGEGEEVIPETLCFVEVKVLKTKVRITFAEGEVGSEEE